MSDDLGPLRAILVSEERVPDEADGEMIVSVSALAEGCHHSWPEDGPSAYFTALIWLGCEPHEYHHTWAYACLECGQQFWPDHVNCDTSDGARIQNYYIDGLRWSA